MKQSLKEASIQAVEDAFRQHLQGVFAVLVDNLIQGKEDAATKFGRAVRIGMMARELAIEQINVQEEQSK